MIKKKDQRIITDVNGEKYISDCNGNCNGNEGDILQNMILFGGSQIGFATNSNSDKVPNFIKVGKEKLVCLAQGGECRFNNKYYSFGLNNIKSWTTPIIDESCPDQCCYKVIVCDDHPDDCEGSIRYYPEHNKFCGIYKQYCRNFDKYIKVGRIRKIRKTVDKKAGIVRYDAYDGYNTKSI